MGDSFLYLLIISFEYLLCAGHRARIWGTARRATHFIFLGGDLKVQTWESRQSREARKAS